jgi:hypothetical protein
MEQLLDAGMVAFFSSLPLDTFFSLSMDIWTSRAHDPYLGVILHFIDDEYNLLVVTIGVDYLPGTHDTARIESTLKKVLASVGLTYDRCLALVKDNASNNKGLASLASLPVDIGCFCHTLQLSVRESIYGRAKFNQGGIKLVVALIRRAAALVGYMRSSPKALHELARVCTTNGIQVKKPQQAVDTRWDSEYRMLVVLVHLWEAIKIMWFEQTLPQKSDSHKTSYVLGESDFVVIRQLVCVLARIEMVTRTLEGSTYVTITDAYIDLTNLVVFMRRQDLDSKDFGCDVVNEHWPADKVHTSIKQLRKVVIRSIKARFPYVDRREPISKWSPPDRQAFEPLLISMALHPQVSATLEELDAPSLTEESRSDKDDVRGRAIRKLQENRVEMIKHCKRCLVTAITDLYRDARGKKVMRDVPGGQRNDEGARTKAQLSQRQSGGGGGSKWGQARERAQAVEHRASVHGDTGGAASEAESPYDKLQRRAQEEVERFWSNKDGEAREVDDPLVQWRETWSRDYRLLAIVQKAYHAIPAASAVTECLFSRSGAILDPRRSSMVPATAKRVVKLHDGYHPSLLDVEGYSTERSKGGKETTASSSSQWRPTVRVSKREAAAAKGREAERAQVNADDGEDDDDTPREVEELLGRILQGVSMSVIDSSEQAGNAEGDPIALLSTELLTGGDDEGGDGSLRDLERCAQEDENAYQEEEYEE